VVVAKALLVDRRAGESDVTDLVECVDVILEGGPRVRFDVGGDSRRVVVDFGW
jgi:hypothetical protein